MGLLDDAIREHLELKRRRGADAEEVARLEQEALGPPQRGEFAAAAAPEARPEPMEASEPVEQIEPMGPADVPVEDLPPEREPEPPAAVGAEPPLAGEPPEEPWLEDEPALEEPTREEADPPAAYAAPAEPPHEGEDVLEETPDFLQETPEHDRLWFEQKPPRDFDLDR